MVLGAQNMLIIMTHGNSNLIITMVKSRIVTFIMLLQDGTANYFKGLMLVLCYLIVAASFYVHVDLSE